MWTVWIAWVGPIGMPWDDLCRSNAKEDVVSGRTPEQGAGMIVARPRSLAEARYMTRSQEFSRFFQKSFRTMRIFIQRRNEYYYVSAAG